MKTLFIPDKDEERSWCHLSLLPPRGQQPHGVLGLRLDNGSIRPGIIWLMADSYLPSAIRQTPFPLATLEGISAACDHRFSPMGDSL